MKTTKKGFTLIELIVVIAIIGVLAAILVPAMLGYVRKSKVSSANSAANSLQKAINTALVEIDEETEEAATISEITGTANSGTVALAADPAPAAKSNVSSEIDKDKVYKKISNYMDKVSKLNFKAKCDGGVCIALVAQVDGAKYIGTYPQGVCTVDNVGEITYDDAYKAACEKAQKNAKAEATTK